MTADRDPVIEETGKTSTNARWSAEEDRRLSAAIASDKERLASSDREAKPEAWAPAKPPSGTPPAEPSVVESGNALIVEHDRIGKHPKGNVEGKVEWKTI